MENVVNASCSGIIRYQGGVVQKKALYACLSSNASDEQLCDYLVKEWGLKLPNLIISLLGNDCYTSKIFCNALLGAAQHRGSWIFTGDIDTSSQFGNGDSRISKNRSKNGNGVVSISFAPWEKASNRNVLLGHKKVVNCSTLSGYQSRFEVLNNRHSHFLLLDGKLGYQKTEIIRHRVERHIADQSLKEQSTVTGIRAGGSGLGKFRSEIPLVSVLVKGDTDTVRTIFEQVSHPRPTPIVVCEGSGGASDIISMAHRFASTGRIAEEQKSFLLAEIKSKWGKNDKEAEELYSTVTDIMEKKHLITLFRMSVDGTVDEDTDGLDEAMLCAMRGSRELSPVDQFSLAIKWNQTDFARELLNSGLKWQPGDIQLAMLDALSCDRVDFVHLFLESGFNMDWFLSVVRLEELYNSKQVPAHSLVETLKDCHSQRSGYRITLEDIDLAINKLLRGAYHSEYSQQDVFTSGGSNKKTHRRVIEGTETTTETEARCECYGIDSKDRTPIKIKRFSHPFNELFLWAVLTKRHQLALLMWSLGEDAMAKALIACNLYKAMAYDGNRVDLESKVREELREHATEFETFSMEQLETCWRADQFSAKLLLARELVNWDNRTSLDLAVAAKHSRLLAHKCCQVVLNDLWHGGLSLNRFAHIKVLCSIIIPPAVFCIDFKTDLEQLQIIHTSAENDEIMRNIRSPRTSLPWQRKLALFYAAPITKFWLHALAYFAFLLIFTYTVLTKSPVSPTWTEYYVVVYIVTFACESINEILSCHPRNLRTKLGVWSSDLWHLLDIIMIFVFLIGFAFHFINQLTEFGRALYCIDVAYWFLRILRLITINKILGSFVSVIARMAKQMAYWCVFLLIIMLSFGVMRQGLLYPKREFSGRSLWDIFFQPYFMLYGEVFADETDPNCTDQQSVSCTGRWITTLIMIAYLLLASVLLMNLLIAVFNNEFQEVHVNAREIWASNRMIVLLELKQQPALPPPLIAISHLKKITKWCLSSSCCGQDLSDPGGLKVFLDLEESTWIDNFERDCVFTMIDRKEEQAVSVPAVRRVSKPQSTDDSSILLVTQPAADSNLTLPPAATKSSKSSREILLKRSVSTPVKQFSMLTKKSSSTFSGTTLPSVSSTLSGVFEVPLSNIKGKQTEKSTEKDTEKTFLKSPKLTDYDGASLSSEFVKPTTCCPSFNSSAGSNF